MSSDAFLLSPYRPPTSYPVSLDPLEAETWLSSWFTLWHPAVLDRLAHPPTASTIYEHDPPTSGCVYALPNGPSDNHPEDWQHRAIEANCIVFDAVKDQAATFENLRQAFAKVNAASELFDVGPNVAGKFAAIGYGLLIVESMFDAMDHQPLLDVDGFKQDMRLALDALKQHGDYETSLRDAAEKLRAAFESLNSNTLAWLDFVVVEPNKLDTPWPSRGPMTVLCSGSTLQRLADEAPTRFNELKANGEAEVACGSMHEREESTLPPESQWFDLTQARITVRKLLDRETTIYARQRSAFHANLPSWLTHCGYSNAILLGFDAALVPTSNSAVVNWPAPDGQTIDAFARMPESANDPQTFFNIVYTLHQAITQDTAPVMALLHRGSTPAVGYAELQQLLQLAPVFGSFTHLKSYLEDYHYGDYLGAEGADDYFNDALDDRVTTHCQSPVTAFARHARLRRKLDGVNVLAALHTTLNEPRPSGSGPDEDRSPTVAALIELEETLESAPISADSSQIATQLHNAETSWANLLAERVQARSPENQPGYLIFNTCSATRRVALEIDNFGGGVPIDGPIKAAEFHNNHAKLVVEVPSLGFAWIPTSPKRQLGPSTTSPKRQLGPSTTSPKRKLGRTAENNLVRNEYFEAELDPTTGGLRAYRDLRTRVNRLGMQLIYNPGSKSIADSVEVTHAGAALGEVTATGRIVDEHDKLLATFRHRLRAWMGRPALELSLHIEPTHKPKGYAWHSYYGARFGWRDDRAALFRGVNGANCFTSQTRPCSNDYLEVRIGGERTFIFTGGLPFLQRHGSRMADVVLIPEGETGTDFELLLAMDRDYPMQTAASWITPTPIVATEKGPPPSGASAWLAHVDLPSLWLTSLRPELGRAVSARFIECAGFGGAADMLFAVSPTSANLINGEGIEISTLTVNDGVVPLEFSAHETMRVLAKF